MLHAWRKKNGLDYNGWFRFILKRKLRNLGLDFLVPFNMYMDWENSSLVTLDIWEFGKHREEKYKFHIDYPLAGDFIDKLVKNGMVSSKQTYIAIKSIGYRV